MRSSGQPPGSLQTVVAESGAWAVRLAEERSARRRRAQAPTRPGVHRQCYATTPDGVPVFRVRLYGIELDAEFQTEHRDGEWTIRLLSRHRKVRRDYCLALETILYRLGGIGASVVDILVETRQTAAQALSAEQRRPPLPTGFLPLRPAFRTDLGGMMTTITGRLGRVGGGSGHTPLKGIRLFLVGVDADYPLAEMLRRGPDPDRDVVQWSKSGKNSLARLRQEADSVHTHTLLPAAWEEDVADGVRQWERIRRSILARRGQSEFRKRLLNIFDDQCAVTGCGVKELLEAAHIVPYAESENSSTENGIILRADIHTLFDLRLLGIDPWRGEVVLSRRLVGTSYEEFGGRRVPKVAALAASRRQFANALAVRFQLGLAGDEG